MAARKKPFDLVDALRKIALAYPETHEDQPWGHAAFKVRGKGFLFTGSDESGTRQSVKLPQSREVALAMPCTEPTHYGMGPWSRKLSRRATTCESEGPRRFSPSRSSRSPALAKRGPWAAARSRAAMGRHGWVTATLTRPDDVPLPLLEDWIDESYRAVAPKKLVATLRTAAPAAPAVKKKAKRKPATAKRATRP